MKQAPYRRNDGKFGVEAGTEPVEAPGRFQKGRAKTGGRKPGVPNRLHVSEQEARALFLESRDGADLPNERAYLEWCWRNPNFHPDLRLKAAAEAASYKWAKKRDITHHNGDLAALNEIYRAGLERVARMNRERKAIQAPSAPGPEPLETATSDAVPYAAEQPLQPMPVAAEQPLQPESPGGATCEGARSSARTFRNRIGAVTRLAVNPATGNSR